MEKVLAVKNTDGLCWNCLKEFNPKDIKIIKIPALGYGSNFDEFATEVHLCSHCLAESTKEHSDLWDLTTVPIKPFIEIDDETERYKYEDEISKFFENMPLEGQQFVFNEFACFYGEGTMEPQDYIDFQLNILPHEKCKEYGLYSPEEKKFYAERFPVCHYPANVIYEDGSKGCRCPFGSYGKLDQKVGPTPCTYCYLCKAFKERTSPIKTMSRDDFNIYEMAVKLKQYPKEVVNKLLD